LHNNVFENDHQKTDGCSFQAHSFPRFEEGCIKNLSRKSELGFKRLESIEELHDCRSERNPGKGKINTDDAFLQSVEKDAYEKGYYLGKNEGFMAGQKTIEPLVEKLQRSLMELETAKSSLFHMAEREAVELSIAIARKIVGNEISVNKNVILNTIKEAFRKVEGHGRVKIRLNPEEIERVKEAMTEMNNPNHGFDKIEFETDEKVQAGGCIIESDIGDIDARIEKQLEVIEEEFGRECLNSIKR
jgi:flagellar biosynthesis/type III secretory pathway protein FliH